MLSFAATQASAQAYIDQTSAGDKNAYVTQTPPTARQSDVAPLPAKKTSSVGQKRAVNGARDAKAPYPSVGKGSAAIVKIDADADEWPTVGRGAVVR